MFCFSVFQKQKTGKSRCFFPNQINTAFPFSFYFFTAAPYADNTFLPFLLLAARTFLPLAVAILFLKPCTLDLCLFFGWNVIFIGRAPPSHLFGILFFANKRFFYYKQETLIRQGISQIFSPFCGTFLEKNPQKKSRNFLSTNLVFLSTKGHKIQWFFGV